MKTYILSLLLLLSVFATRAQSNLPVDLFRTPPDLFPSAPASLSVSVIGATSLSATAYADKDRDLLPATSQPVTTIRPGGATIAWTGAQTATMFRTAKRIWLVVRQGEVPITAGYVNLKVDSRPRQVNEAVTVFLGTITVADINIIRDSLRTSVRTYASQAQAAAAQATSAVAGIQSGGYQTAAQVATAPKAATTITGLATVGTTGNYSDLTNRPTIPTTPAQIGLGNVPNVDATNRANHQGTQSFTTLSGRAAPSQLGSDTPAPGRYLDGSGQWVPLPVPPVSSVNGQTGAVTITIPQPVTTLTGLSNAGTQYQTATQVQSAVYAGVTDKVVKVAGKGLSANDYLDADKTKLAAIPSDAQSASQVAGAVAGATNPLSASISQNAANLQSHAANTANPHGVTKLQVGLGNVPNIDATQRGNHQGTQPISTVDGLQTALDSRATVATVNAAVAAQKARTDSTNAALGGKQATLGYVPYNATNPSNYQTATQVAIAVSVQKTRLDSTNGAVGALGRMKADTSLTGANSRAIAQRLPIADFTSFTAIATPMSMAQFRGLSATLATMLLANQGAVVLTDPGREGLFRVVSGAGRTDDGALVLKNIASPAVALERVIQDGRLNLTWWGAKLDGVADDTPAFQEAYNSLPDYEQASRWPRVLYWKGTLKFDPTSFVPSNKYVKIIVDGYLKPTSTWVFRQGVWDIEGVGGGLPAQFQTGICAGIIPFNSTDPVMEVRRAYGFTLKKFSIIGGGPAIRITNTVQPNSNIRFEDIGIQTANVAGVPLDIDNAFWVDFLRVYILNFGPSGSKTIRISSNASGDGRAGLLNFRDCITAGRGIDLAQNDPGHYPGNITFTNHAHESIPADEDFLVSRGAGTWSGLSFENLINADQAPNWTGKTFDVPNVSNFQLSRQVEAVTFRGQPLSGHLNGVDLYSAAPQLLIRPGVTQTLAGETVGSHQGRVYNALTTNAGIPVSYVMPTTAQAGSLSFTAGQMGPDGTLSAWKVVPETGVTGFSDRKLFYRNGPVQAGDWYLFGTTTRPGSETANAGGLGEGDVLQLGLNAGAASFDGAQGKPVPATRVSAMIGGGWVVTYGYAKIATSGSGDLSLAVRTYGQNQYYLTKPYLRRIPAAWNWTETDVVNYLRGNAALSPSAGSGVAATPDHIPIRPGVQPTSTLPSAVTAGGGAIMYDATLNRPVWSDGINWNAIALPSNPAQLSGGNSFTGNQSVAGGVTVSGAVDLSGGGAMPLQVRTVTSSDFSGAYVGSAYLGSANSALLIKPQIIDPGGYQTGQTNYLPQSITMQGGGALGGFSFRLGMDPTYQGPLNLINGSGTTVHSFQPNGNTVHAGSLTHKFASGTANPTTTDIPSGYSLLWKNTSTGDIRQWSNDGNTLTSSSGGSSAKAPVTNTNVSTSYTIDLSTSDFHVITLTGNTTLTLSNMDTGRAVYLKVVQGGAGSFTLTFPTSVKFPGGAAVDWSTVAGGYNVFLLTCSSSTVADACYARY